MAVTKAQAIYDRIEAMIASGTEKADAFRQIAEEAGRPFDSVRGSYYSHKKKLEGGESAKPSRTRRRETTPDDALADARAALERAIASIDREVEVAKAGPTRRRPSTTTSRRVLGRESRPSPSAWRR
jgi:hypothetical protein